MNGEVTLNAYKQCVNCILVSVVMLLGATASAGSLYAVDSDTLYRADPNDGSWQGLTPGWTGTELMVGYGGMLYAIHGGSLYRTNPADGSWQELSGGWTGTVALTAAPQELYAIHGGLLYRVDSSRRELASIDWRLYRCSVPRVGGGCSDGNTEQPAQTGRPSYGWR